MGRRILKPYTLNIKKLLIFILPLCFTKKIVDFLILGKERDNSGKHKFSLLHYAPQREDI